ncbi:hypothetical protein ACE10Z_33610 [Bradyrhizobium sp. Pha-3]|uniref:hypothetical protein n=1 Tax=Bradyrhizobium sp. Pha-3 TaxID=208375 RepID=UPI0035D4F391
MAYVELAFQFAKEVSTQLITISSALIGLSVTFVKDLKTDEPLWLRISWGLYIASIFFGVWHLMALTGALESLSAPGKTFESFKWPTRLPAIAQIVTFICGTICLIKFGWRHGLQRH